MPGPPAQPTLRVARIIARLNVGGPAHHVTILTARLKEHGIESTLLVGRPAKSESSFDTVVARAGVTPVDVPHLAPEISPLADLRAVFALSRMLRALKPQVIHTHTAKAGTLGRIAALTVWPRPIIVHTFHGHVLEGYFGSFVTTVYRLVEKLLARYTDRLVAVSEATIRDLVRLGVAPHDRFAVVPLGFDLQELLAVGPPNGATRSEFGAGPDDVLLTFVGRLAPIKRVDILLDAFAAALHEEPRLRLLIVGDGELRRELENRAQSLGVEERVVFTGFRFDLIRLASATDVAVLSSDNEGTPVALIEAAAAGRPLVSTDVGGVADIVDETTGRCVAKGDVAGLATAFVELARDPELRQALGAEARRRVRHRYSAERLVDDVASLYRELYALRHSETV